MWKSHLKIALRSFLRHRSHAFINLLGLTLGFTICLLIFTWVNYEIGFDRFHQDSENIYRTSWQARYGDNEWHTTLVPVPLARVLEEEFPEVDATTRLYYGALSFEKETAFIEEDRILYTDENFLQIFDVHFVAGSLETALAKPKGIVLTEASARKYLGKKNPLGKTLRAAHGEVYEITAVVQAFPEQSHIEFDFLRPIDQLAHIERQRDWWGYASCLTYFRLLPGTDPIPFMDKFDAYVQNELNDEAYGDGNNFSRFPIQALHNVHLHANLENDTPGNGIGKYIYLFSLIGVLILALACINFINLNTARSLHRAKEIGVRKTLGSQKHQLISQFFAEAGLMVLGALVLAIVCCYYLMPTLNGFLNRAIPGSALLHPTLIFSAIGLWLAVTLLSGIVPALMISAVRPAVVLKGLEGVALGGQKLRKGLVILQFCISAGLIIATLAISAQMRFLQQVQLGFDQEHVVVVEGAQRLGKNYETFIQTLKTLATVVGVGPAQTLPGKGYDSTVFRPEQPANFKETSLHYSGIQPPLLDVLKINVLEGRNFRLDSPADSNAYLINQAAAEALGWDQPLGRTLSLGGYRYGQIIGVMEDFHFKSLHHEIEPLIFFKSKRSLNQLAVRLTPGSLDDQIRQLASAWKDHEAEAPFTYSFLDENIGQLYAHEQTTSKLFHLFAMIGMFIACLGLLGLSSIVSLQRSREMSIRKVLGASTLHLFSILNREFAWLLASALLLAIPLSYYFLQRWLDNFAYHTTLTWTLFALGIGAVSIIALLTVSYHSLKVAWQNPKDVLREG